MMLSSNLHDFWRVYKIYASGNFLSNIYITFCINQLCTGGRKVLSVIFHIKFEYHR